jgi:hypothetical protein
MTGVPIVAVDSRQDEAVDAEPVANDVSETTDLEDTQTVVLKRRVIRLASDENLTSVEEPGQANDIVEAADRDGTIDPVREVSVEDESTAGGIASKVRNSQTPKRHQKPTVDYTGTTRAF